MRSLAHDSKRLEAFQVNIIIMRYEATMAHGAQQGATSDPIGDLSLKLGGLD